MRQVKKRGLREVENKESKTGLRVEGQGAKCYVKKVWVVELCVCVRECV